MKRATLEIQQENQLSTTGNDKKVTKILIIILTIICINFYVTSLVNLIYDKENDFILSTVKSH